MKDKYNSSGIGFFGLLSIAFIVLKLCDVIDWSWWWVISPLWLPFSVGLLMGFIWEIIDATNRKL